MTRMTKAMTLASVLALSACASIDSTPDAPQVSQNERQAAGQQHQQILEQFGGAYQGSQSAYVAQVGARVASAAGLPGQCTFTVVNSDVVNAFAVPGCYIYVTRGLLSIANSEAELASVLGHEVGHVVADHSAQRQNRSLLTGLGAILLGVVTGSGDLAQLAGQAGQLYTLRFSRDQEYQADDLGIRYLVRAGYAPLAAADLLDQLGDHDALMARTRGRDAETVPEWGRTHPLTAERVARAAATARATGIQAPEQEEVFLSALNGMLYGDDPAQGFVTGRTFAHPALRVGFEAPVGFTLTNSTRAVLVESPNGAKAQFTGGRATGSVEDHARTVLTQLVGQTPTQVGQAQRTTINGLEAVILPAQAQTQNGLVEVTVAAYRFGPETIYHFVSLAPSGASNTLTPLFRSVRRLSESEAASLRPRRIEVITARSGDTVSSLSGRMAVEDLKQDWFTMLNARDPAQPIRAGERLKLVVYGG